MEAQEQQKIIDLLSTGDADMMELGQLLAAGMGWDLGEYYDLSAWERLNIGLKDIFCKYRYLSVRELYGYRDIPDSIGKMGHLRSLTVNHAKLVNAEIWKLTGLEVLELKSNYLEDLPQELVEFKCLRDLILTSNYFEQIPEVVGKLKSLRTLHLSQNNIKYIPHYICNLPLTELYLNQNRIEHLPSDMGRMVKLRKLFLKGNKIRQFPSSMHKLKDLKMLLLIGNPIPKSEKKRLEEMLPNCNIYYGY